MFVCSGCTADDAPLRREQADAVLGAIDRVAEVHDVRTIGPLPTGDAGVRFVRSGSQIPQPTPSAYLVHLRNGVRSAREHGCQRSDSYIELYPKGLHVVRLAARAHSRSD